MDWFEFFLCLLYHSNRSPQVVQREAIPSTMDPGWGLLRDIGPAPIVTALPDEETFHVSGRVAGSSDTIPADNLSATISATYQQDYNIHQNDIEAGRPHTLQADVSVDGVFKHRVTAFSSPGAVTGPFLPPLPTDASTSATIVTTISVFELGVTPEIAVTRRTHFSSTRTEGCCVGPCTGGLCALVPVIEDVATSILFDGSPITLRFTPSGNAHLLVRVATVVTATANGASADVEIGGSAPSSLFNDPLTGTLDVSLDSLTYSIDVESTDPCFEVLR